jgi:DNA repair protein RecO (recombination protein O)
MPLESSAAFVLGTSPLNEQDKIVHMLTEDRGILKAVAPGAFKSGNRFGAKLELFSEARFFYYWREERELITLSKAEMIRSHFEMVSRAENVFYFYLIAEVTQKMVPHNQKDQRVFRLIRAVLSAGSEGRAMADILLYFLVWLLRIEGMMFKPRLCYNCFKRDIDQAWIRTDFRGILCGNCRTDEREMLGRSELEYIDWTQRHGPEEVGEWQGRLNTRKLISQMIRKMAHHGECGFSSTRYLPGFK